MKHQYSPIGPPTKCIKCGSERLDTDCILSTDYNRGVAAGLREAADIVENSAYAGEAAAKLRKKADKLEKNAQA